MFVTVQDLLVQLQTGALLPPSAFDDIDLDAVLDRRDSDRPFEQDWWQAHADLNAAWAADGEHKGMSEAVERVRRESFEITSRQTQRRELASYVSDEFALIAMATAVGAAPPFVVGLWEAYAARTFPLASG